MHTHLRGKFPLIGIAAPAQSGKSTVAAYLKRTLGYTEDSFAAPIRAFVAGLLGTTVPGLEPIKEQPVPWIGKSPRQLMQTLGTEWGRELITPDLWLSACMQRVARSDGRVVISDVRFENEAAAVRAAGGVILHLTRPTGRPVVATHASETPVERVSGVDFQIVNDGTVSDLNNKVASWHYAIWEGVDLERYVCQPRS